MFKPITKVEHIPNKDGFMIIRQFSDGGPLFTDNNDGKGYTEEEAIRKTQETYPRATITPTPHEVGCTVNGRPSYRWVERWTVNTPDGGIIAPPMTLAEAKAFCRSKGWIIDVKRGVQR